MVELPLQMTAELIARKYSAPFADVQIHATVANMDGLPTIVARYLQAYNQKDISGMISCFTEDVVFENASNAGSSARTDGKAELAKLAEQAARLFRQRQQTVKRIVAGENAVALEIVYRAVVAVDLPNGWKAGQTIDLRGASFFRLRDGLIAELTDLS
jgi:steroid delta-isomerase-like uncharacterized protein